MEDENVKLIKIQRSSGIALTVANIAKVCAIVLAILLILGGLLLLGVREWLNEEIMSQVESGEISWEEFLTGLDSESARHAIMKGYVAETMAVCAFVGGIVMIFEAVIMHFIGRMFKSIKESYSPFRLELMRSLKAAAVLITLLTLRNSLLEGAVVGFSFWCILHIFEYGCMLQKQSDETL